MIKILFVCLGNICRSPMAEAVFAHKVKAAGLEKLISADSAGTGDWHEGEDPHRGTQKLLREKQIDCTHKARTLKRVDFDDFDLILTMDEDNFQTAGRRGSGKAELRRLLDFAPDCGYTEVPDPWYSGNFQQTHDLVSEAADGVLKHLRDKFHI